MVAASLLTPAVRQKLTSNTGARVKKVSHGGRDYLVAPASLIVPGVLNGSDGALYYPLEEVVKNAKAWDDMPIVVYHPTKNGIPVAAQDPTHSDYVLRESGIGFLRNSRALNKLASEAWFDVEYVQDYDKKLQPQFRIYPRLLRNESIELSTGLIVDKDYTPGVCPTTGRSYDAVARNYRPDHLAVLPDMRGACSIQDGCGVIMNSEQPSDDVDSEKACEILHDGEANGKELTDAQRRMFGAACHKTTKNEAVENGGKYGNPQCGDSGKFMPHGSGTGKGEPHQAAKKGFESVQDAAEAGGDSSVEVEESEDTIENADGWVTLPNGVHVEIKDGEIVKGPDIAGKGHEKDVSASKKAQSLTEKATKSASASDHKAAAEAHRDAAKHYLAKGDTAKAKSHSGLAVKHAQEYATKKHTKNLEEGPDDQAVVNEEGEFTMPLKAEERKGLVAKIVANCKCQGEHPDAEVLNKLSDATLLHLNAMPEALAKAKAKRVSENPEEEEQEDDEEDTKKGKYTGNRNQEKQIVTNTQQQPMSAKEWLEAAPPEIRSAVTNALKVERNARQVCVDKLVANAPEPKRESYGKLLSTKPLEELEMLVDMLPPTRNVDEISQLFAPVFAGSGYESTGGVGRSGVLNAEEETLPLPVANWEEEDHNARLKKNNKELVGA